METISAPEIAATSDAPDDGERDKVSAKKSLVAITMTIATFLVLLLEAPSVFAVWQGPVTYGFSIGQKTLTIGNVDEREAAEGLRNGMRVQPNGESAWRLRHPLLGARVTVLNHGRQVAVTAHHDPPSQAEAIVVTLSLLITFALIVFAGVLCYRRPGVMTVALWLFAITNCDARHIELPYYQIPENAARPLIVLVNSFIGGWGFYPLVWFALRFPNNTLQTRAMRLSDYAWSVLSIAALAWFIADGFMGLRVSEFWSYTLPQNLPSIMAVAALLWVYVRSPETVRQRAVWAIAGLITTVIVALVANFVNETSTDYLLADVLLLISTACPFALVYSVLRHQLLDISFVVNRALVFSTLTAFIVGIVALADYVISKFLSQTRVAFIVEAAVTVGVGFALQRVHGLLEGVVDRVVFASRHAAEKHTDRVISGLAFAKSHQSVLGAVVEEPRVTLDLQSAGVFIREGDTLKLAAHHGWHIAGVPEIEVDDPLARLLQAERKSVDIAESRWHADIRGFAPGSLQIAVPLFSRNDLFGIVFYGRHRNGSALDPEERALLLRLCQAGAVAYEAVELQQAREQLATFRDARTVTGAA
jgi:hypothetical protein